jgi:hypothetical protein
MTTVNQLLSLWTNEGFEVVKLGMEVEPANKKLKWELYLLTHPRIMFDDYGRHGVLRVLAGVNTNKIIKDELFNASVRAGENLYQIPVRGEMG